MPPAHTSSGGSAKKKKKNTALSRDIFYISLYLSLFLSLTLSLLAHLSLYFLWPVLLPHRQSKAKKRKSTFRFPSHLFLLGAKAKLTYFFSLSFYSFYSSLLFSCFLCPHFSCQVFCTVSVHISFSLPKRKKKRRKNDTPLSPSPFPDTRSLYPSLVVHSLANSLRFSFGLQEVRTVTNV